MPGPSKSSRLLLSGAVFGLVVAALASQPGGANAAKLHEVPLPRGSREVAPDLYTSSLSFRKAVRYYRRILRARGWLHEAVPIYRYRGTLVARFLSRQPGSKWAAIQVFRHRGRTHIAVVPTTPLTPPDSQGKESAP